MASRKETILAKKAKNDELRTIDYVADSMAKASVEQERSQGKEVSAQDKAFARRDALNSLLGINNDRDDR